MAKWLMHSSEKCWSRLEGDYRVPSLSSSLLAVFAREDHASQRYQHLLDRVETRGHSARCFDVLHQTSRESKIQRAHTVDSRTESWL